ncbi:MAG: hypothetical protein U1F11_15190 [Steroidobacteraceae bacterium]
MVDEVEPGLERPGRQALAVLAFEQVVIEARGTERISQDHLEPLQDGEIVCMPRLRPRLRHVGPAIVVAMIAEVGRRLRVGAQFLLPGIRHQTLQARVRRPGGGWRRRGTWCRGA